MLTFKDNKGQGGNSGKNGEPKPKDQTGKDSRPDSSGQGQNNPQRAADQRRKDQAKKELGLSDQQVQNLLNEMQKREKQYQRYFSPNPKQEQKNPTDPFGALSRQQREMMQRLFGKQPPGSGDPNQAQEDW